MASGEESSESLKCKTWVLKVSIHCEGCKKKVKRILRSIQGVYDSEIDARQHKVTVKASVNAETIIRKLEKSGKHAVLWPEKKPSINQNANNGSATAGSEKEDKETSATKEPSENPEKKPTISSETSPIASSTEAKHSDAKAAPIEEPANPSTKTEEAEAKAKSLAEPPNPNAKTEESDTKMPQNSESDKADTPTQQPGKLAASTAPAEAEINKKGSAGVKVDGPEKLAASRVPAEAEINKKDSTGVKEDGDNCGVKKKPSMAQKNIRKDAGTNLDSRSANPPPSSPPQNVYSYPAHPHPPEYVMSYNMVQPTISHAYYAPPMPPASQGYFYTPYPPPEFYYGSFDPSLPAPLQQPPPHHYMFNEENPNACYIM